MLVYCVFVLLSLPALARSTNGSLYAIQTPNNGMPALTTPGGSFDAMIASKGELQLSAGDRLIPLTAQWEDAPGEYALAHCRIPADIPPGTYALQWKNADLSDINVRSVFVYAAFPEYYSIAHVSDTHLGKRASTEATNTAVIQAVNASGAVLAAVTGDLTESGDDAQFRDFLRVLDTCTLPTFVCPGNHDRQPGKYEQFFGPTCYMFGFGRDGYISFDTKDFSAAGDLGPQDGLLETYRRALKPSRWVVGLTHRYEAMQGMRSQLTLFSDDPLDCLLFGHWHRENTAEQRTVPWGTTPITVVPAAVNGKYRIIDVTEKGLLPRPFSEVQQAPEPK